MVIILAVIWFVVRMTNNQKKLSRDKYKRDIIEKAKEFMEEVKENKTLPTVATSLFLDEGEKAILEEHARLMETRAVRVTGGTGLGFRVAKGVYLGGYSGQSESHKEWRVIDEGSLILTNKRFIFKGNKENRSIPLDKVLSVGVMLDAIEVTIDSKAKSLVFLVTNPYVWGGSVQIIRKAADPFDLKNIKLDIELN